jgi:surface protein
MSIYKGNKKVVALYKGATPIIRRYKGTQLIFDATQSDEPIINDTLSFAWSGTSSTMQYKINGTTYTASTNPYSTTLSELGITDFTNANTMFNSKRAITAVTSIPDTSNVTNMYYMFRYLGVSELEVTKTMNTSACTNMGFMFAYCPNLTSLDLSSFDTSRVYNMEMMFYNDTKLDYLNISGWDLRNVTSKSAMFGNGCKPSTIIMNGCDCDTILFIRQQIQNNGVDHTKVVQTDTVCPTYETSSEITYNIHIEIPSCAYNQYVYPDGVEIVTNITDEYGVSSVTSNWMAESDYIVKFQLKEGGMEVEGDNPTSEERVIVGIVYYNDEYIGEYTFTQLGNTLDDDYDIILELEDYGNGYGQFKLNNKTIEPTTSPYKANLSDLGIDELTSFNFSNSNITKIVKMPNTSKVTTLSNNFAYSSLESIDTSDWDLSSLNNASFAYGHISKPKNIHIDTEAYGNCTNFQGFYGGCTSLTNASLPNTDNVTNLSYAFYKCSSLEVATFTTMVNCNSIAHMFDGCSSLTSVNGNFFPNVLEDASYCFKDCSSIPMTTWRQQGKLNYLLKQGVCTNTSNMFNGTNFDDGIFRYDEWKVSNVTDMSYMFANTNITEFNFEYWDWWRCTNFSYMFENCDKLISIDFSNKDFQSAEDMSYMFASCDSLREVKFNSINSTFNPTNVDGMFDKCPNLQTVRCNDCNVYNVLKQALESSGLDYSQILLCEDCDCGDGSIQLSCNFDKSTPINELYIDMNDLPSVEGYWFISFSYDQYSDGDCDNCSWDSGNAYICLHENSYKINGYGNIRENIGSITDLPLIDGYYHLLLPKPMYFKCGEMNAPFDKVYISHPLGFTDKIAFTSYNNSQEITLNDKQYGLYDSSDYSEIEDGKYIFNKSIYDLTNGDIDSCDQIYSTRRMFYGCYDINTLEILPCTTNVTNMSEMFSQTESITPDLNLTSLDTSNVTDMSNMFYQCAAITMDLSGWNTANVTNMNYMFYNCEYLETLDLSGWSLNWSSGGWNILETNNMFSFCIHLEEVIMKDCSDDTISCIRQALDECGRSSTKIVTY